MSTAVVVISAGLALIPCEPLEVFGSPDDAFADIKSGSVILSSGFGL